MTEKSIFLKHTFNGGFATDFGENADPEIKETVMIPFLVEAENVVYSLDGGPRKAGGTAKLNSTELESGANIKGLYDAWLTGTTGSPTQHRICHVGTKIKKDDADGVFTDLFTGLDSGKVPSYAILEDLIVMASDSVSDVPKSWDGTTAQDLAGTPPNFSIVEEHKNKLWATGVASDPSALFYSVSLNPEDWIGTGSGRIQISPDDGDIITGLASHKDELWVFKGTKRGSIHRITGDSPADFARKTFIDGLGAGGHNTIFRFGNDLGFMWSDGTVHSLAATEAFGDFKEASLTRDFNKWLKANINFSRINHFHAVNDTNLGYVLFSIAINGATTNNYTLMMDYRFSPVRWSLWSAFISGSLASVIDPTDSDKRIIMAGGVDGFVRKYDREDRSIDGITGIGYKVTTPYLDYGSSIILKTINQASLGMVRKNDADILFGWRRDDNAQQTENFSQSGFDVLGASAMNQFILNTSVLASGNITTILKELTEGGEFRIIQYQITDSSNLNDVDIRNFGAAIEGGSWSTE